MLRCHSGTQKRGGRTTQRDQIDNEARLFWKSIVKTKHQSLTSLAFIRLVPGADRAVRHICIRCIGPDVVKINNSFDLSEANRRKLSEILKEFDNFPIGETNETYKGYVFNSHDQKEDESVDAYVGELRTLAQLCNFCMCLHDTLICNLVVLGICDEGSCKRLFRQGKLTLQKIYRNH